MKLAEQVATGVFFAIGLGLILTNPKGDTAILSGLQNLITGVAKTLQLR